MKTRPPLPLPPYLVVGLARSGTSAAAALRGADPSAPILACDSGRPEEAIEALDRLNQAGVEVHLDTDGVELLASSQRPRTVVKSPGVPRDAPVIARALDLGLDVVGELEIGWRLLPNEFCAVTGTNGKTTTAELIGAVYRAAGLPATVAGNVGTPLSSYAGELAPDATVVCEASSFQLEDSVAFAPEVGVFLNVAEDHLDRHPDLSQYLDAKLRLFTHQAADDVAILNATDPVIRDSEVGGSARRVWFGNGAECELRLEGGRLWWEDRALMDASELALRGAHNLDNAMAAAAATLVRGIDPEAVRQALHEFRGVPHRLEEVNEIDDVLYVNDSKATNVAAAIASLRAFEGGVHVILGGRSKGGQFGTLAPVVAERCRAAYLIGEAAATLEEELASSAADVELIRAGDLERALAEASQRAREGEVVLLAPACASFDQYKNFEERGEHFRALVGRLAQSGRGAS
jgi:UDP-N-acetylmuramoylalanine--D-glutamate ligase